MKRKAQNTLVGLLLAGSTLLVSVDIAAARGGMGAMGGAGGPQSLMRADFSTLDANGDGAITMDEVQAQGAAQFATMDADASGALDADEVIAMITVGIEQRMGNRQGGEQGGGNGEHARPDRKAPSAVRLAWMAKGVMLRFDENNDDLISAEEMQPPARRLEKLFSRVDSDGDGSITQAEFDAAKEGRGGHSGQSGHGRP